MNRPNILFLMSDEHRYDLAGFAGNDVIRTPTLDWLAQTGVVFDNAYTPSPICIPGRQAMMTGKFPKHCGCEHFGQDIEPGSMTFARRLSQYGYDSVCCGKLHHVGPDQMQGWTQRPFGDIRLKPWAIDGLQRDQLPEGPKWKDFKWSDAKEIKRAGIGPSRYAEADKLATATAINHIRNHFCDVFYDRPTAYKPLLLKHSLIQPHYPYMTDQDKLEYYINRVTPFSDEEVFGHPFLSQREVVPGKDVNDRELKRVTAAYYGMVETIDEHYGSVLDMLRQVGQDLDDWIIIYTSDHGEMLGQHGIWEKQKFFEASVRVPLIIRYPRRFQPGRVRQNVNLCDLFATLTDLTDVPTPDDLDSRSLVALMEGNPDGWDDESVSQFKGTNCMIKRGDLKYQWYGEDMPEVLFDLSADPGETQNIIDQPPYAEAVKRFRGRLKELGFGPGS
ncbi:MAG: sulfatase-like hydrolase/transferase [Phycisphaerae bacterium]